MTRSEDAWTGRAGFVLAAIGSAVGLGNIWRFSYVAGENGGAVFLPVYGVCVLLIGLPVLLSEFVLGSRARADVLLAFSHARAARAWRGAGVLAALVAFLILSYYSVIAGWACRYFVSYVNGTLPGLPRDALPDAFQDFVSDPWQPALWHALFITLTALVAAAGIARGIERASRILMPMLAAMVILLAGYALSLPGASRGLAFLFTPDWSALATPRLYLAALGQAFFSLGVAMGVMITYAGYVRSRERLASSAVAVAVGDTLFAIVAGMAIFPIVFAFGMDPAYGPALAFVTLPQVFAIMPEARGSPSPSSFSCQRPRSHPPCRCSKCRWRSPPGSVCRAQQLRQPSPCVPSSQACPLLSAPACGARSASRARAFSKRSTLWPQTCSCRSWASQWCCSRAGRCRAGRR
jgi:NSS family neurotransmitter:Na+ symporter